jgi:LPXTG cell wall anchor motif
VNPVDRGGDDRLERDLAELRSDASDDFVGSLAERCSTRGRGSVWSRAAFAAAFATLTIGGFVSFGGTGYAASSVANAFDSIVRVSHPASHHHVVKPTTAASDQYTTKKAPKVGKHHNKVLAAPKSAPFKPPVVAAGTAKTLPFTGVSLAFTSALALTFIALGIFLRRRERKQE